jgi:LuxR family transcriptional regulator, maltose regulon positive regulatory protein
LYALAVSQIGQTEAHSGAEDGIETPAETLVATKLRPPPPRRSLVARPRLLDRLRADHLPKVTLVDAPAGWGKTTLLLDWLSADQAKRRFAWLALDREDNDAARFWSYVVEALRTVQPRLGDAVLASLRVPGTSVVHRILPGLINELAELGERTILVLDDYHLVTNAEIHEGIAYLVEHLPTSLRLALATRSDPPLPLPALRVRGELVEIRSSELRFRPEEAVTLLNDTLDLSLGSAECARLQERTEGWAAGLFLAALSLRGRSDASAFIAEFAGDDRHVVDYLGSEVLSAQPQEVRTFLLRTSILDRLSGPLCDAVTGAEGSARMLEWIERANLFLVPLDANRRWYRYHHLFTELLRHELETAEPELLPTLHGRAADWLRLQGSVPDAIHHAALAGDFDMAGDLIAFNWAAFLQRGELETVGTWLSWLPAEAVADDPRLCLTRAWIAVNEGRIEQIDRWVEATERAVARQSSGEETMFRAASEMLRCIHRYMEGDVGGAIEAARRARELEPDEHAPWRSVGCPVLGIATFWRGEPLAAADILGDAVRRARRAGNNLAVIHASSCLAAIHAERGELEDGERFARTALGLAEEYGLEEHWATTMAHVVHAGTLERRRQLDEADAEASRAVALSRRGVAHAEIAYALQAHARARHEMGDAEGARRLLQDARETVESCPDPGILVDILATAEHTLGRASRPTAPPPTSGDELTERELVVLRLLGTELSLREIGAELYVSHNTVKTHCRGIYRKLGAAGREEAFARAREVGLL